MSDVSMSKYSKMTDEDFDEILKDVLEDVCTGELLSIPGIYEILAEEYNNEVLDRWERRQPHAEDEDDDE